MNPCSPSYQQSLSRNCIMGSDTCQCQGDMWWNYAKKKIWISLIGNISSDQIIMTYNDHFLNHSLPWLGHGSCPIHPRSPPVFASQWVWVMVPNESGWNTSRKFMKKMTKTYQTRLNKPLWFQAGQYWYSNVINHPHVLTSIFLLFIHHFRLQSERLPLIMANYQP